MWRDEKLVEIIELDVRWKSCILDKVNKGLLGSKGMKEKLVEEFEEGGWGFFLMY